MSVNHNVAKMANLRTDHAITTKKPYQSPQLQSLGDLRGVTLGTSGGAGESGSSPSFTHKN